MNPISRRELLRRSAHGFGWLALGALLARESRATQPHFAAGSKLTVNAVKAFSDESGMGAYDATIELAGAEVAKARIIVFEPPDFEAFMASQKR